MKSTTVGFNLFSLLTLVLLTVGAYMGKFEMGSAGYIVSVVIISVVSQLITFFDQSGQFVGHGQNWTTGKWVTRAGMALLAVGSAFAGYGVAVAAVAFITPFIEIAIRVYGTDTEKQRQASK